MKLIRAFLDGGIYASVVNPYADPTLGLQPADTSSKSSKSSSSEGLISKTVLAKLQQVGLPNDVNRFMQELADFEDESSRDALMGKGINKHKLYALLAYANQVIQQASYLKTAEEQAVKNDAWDEIAVDARGNFFAIDESGKVKKVHMSKYNPESEYALSVGELVERRKFAPDTIDDSSITTAIGSNIGLSKINSYIQDIIKSVGSTTNSNEAYTELKSIVGADLAKRPTEQQMAALKELYGWTEKVGLDSIFKVKDEISLDNMEAAIKYIYSVLPNNMRTLLEGRYVAMGGKYSDSNKYALGLIQMAADAGNTTKYSHSIDYDSAINKGAQTKSGQNEIKAQKANLKVLEQLVQGTLGKRDFNLTSSKNPELSVTLHGTGVGALANFNNNIVSEVPLSIAMQEALGPLVDANHVYMGDQKVNPGAFDSILYNGLDVLNIWAPVDSNGDIDFQGLQQFNEIQLYIDNDPSMSTNEKNNLLKQYGIGGYYDEQGTFHGQGNMGQFLVFTGVTSDEILDESKNNFADKITGDAKKLEMQLIDRIYANINSKIKTKDGKFEFKKGVFSTDIIHAPVFMRLNPTAQIDVGTFSDHGPLVNTLTYGEQAAYDLMRYNQSREIQVQKPSTSLLYGNE